MSDRGDGQRQGGTDPQGRGRPHRPTQGRGPVHGKGGQKSGGPRRRGGIGLNRIGGSDFELVHPRCVREMELDFEEGIELRKAGDPEAARDALRYALQGCGDNLWVHVALGAIALEEFRDPALARGHFGYAFELAERAFPPNFTGRLPRHRPANRPFYDAIDGLVAAYEALGKPQEAAKLRGRAADLAGDSHKAGGRAGVPGE